MHIWIFQTGEPLHIDNGSPRPMRAMNLANTLVASGHHVTIWSAAFFHQEKRHRVAEYQRIKVNEMLDVRLIPSRGYVKNIGLGRLIDHAILARNLKAHLSKEVKTPDVAFIGYPPIEFAYVAVRWLGKNNVPTMVDVKDLWPSIFVDKFPGILQPILRFVLLPYFVMAKHTFKSATALSTMSLPYLNWMLEYSGRTKSINDVVAPLTVQTTSYTSEQLHSAENWWEEKGVPLGKTRIISFVGSFMSVFDFSLVREAAVKLKQNDVTCLFVLAGDGGFVEETKREMADLPNVLFPGWIDGAKMSVLYKHSSCAVIPYKNIENYTLNTPNKVVDAVANGVPIITSLSGEVERLVSEHGIGFVCNKSTGLSFYSAIKDIINNPHMANNMTSNCLDLYNRAFLFDKVYSSLVSHLEQLVVDDSNVHRCL